MGQFRVFLIGHSGGMPLVVPASSLGEVERLIGGSRFLAGELIDVPDEYGICTNRSALIPLSRVQMIVEDSQ